MSLTKEELQERTCQWGVVLPEDESISWTNEALTKACADKYLQEHPELDTWGQRYVWSLSNVMLCKHMKDEIKNFDIPPIESDDYVAEFKENGMRVVVCYDPLKYGFEMFTRKESDITCLNGNITDKTLFIRNGFVSQPKDWVGKFPYRFVLDGEILADGETVLDGVEYGMNAVEDFIQSIFSAGTEKAIEIQKAGHNMSFHIFDVLYFQKDNLEVYPEMTYSYKEDEVTPAGEKWVEEHFRDYLESAQFIKPCGKKKAKPKKLYAYLLSLRKQPKYSVMHFPFLKRRKLRHQLVELLAKNNLPFIEVDGRDDAKVTYLDEVLSAGFEGIILKNIHAPYIAGLRSSRSHRACMKVKQSISQIMDGQKMYEDFDVFITGANPPKSPRIKDMIGSLSCSIYMIDDRGEQVIHEIANVSGLSHEWKRKLAQVDDTGKISLNPAYLNKVIAVDGMALSGTSLKFHHAVLKNKETLEFKAKNPTDCCWDIDTLRDMVLTRGK